MELKSGTRLGPYEIVSQVGAGGMGEVWKARDTRLDRTVAVKVMPKHIAAREDLRQRFEREARTVSSLNHPNICVLHDIGKQDGIDFMVLEYLEGETLAARIAKGPLPLDQALRYALQIADALDRAHRKGVVHRDVKPANVMITREGVKVLDFGLAKSSVNKPRPGDETRTIALTEDGTVVGTPQYMAPELYAGVEADIRADIFGFGCVLYEMVTGKRAFDGKTRVSVVASVIGAEPQPMSTLAPVIPASLERLVKGCLVKDPEERYQSLWDVLMELRGIGEGASGQFRADPVPDRAVRPVWWIAAAGVATVAAAVLALIHFREVAPEARPAQFVVEAPGDTQFTSQFAATAVSPDGRYLVFTAGQQGSAPLWVRPIDSLSARPLPGTEGANFPFWSPDSRSVAFIAGNKLKRSELAGGAPQVLCEATSSALGGAGGTWNGDGTILFGSVEGLLRVPASGGVPRQVTKVDSARKESEHGVPQFLPGGDHFIYFIRSSDPNIQGIYAGSLADARLRVRIVATDRKAYYARSPSGQSGYLMWMREQTLFAQRFDNKKLRLEGDAASVADGLAVLPQGVRAAFWVSDAGLLVYRSGARFEKTKLVWTGRDGKNLTEAAKEDKYGSGRLSPDGRRFAVGRADDSDNSDIWVLELGRGVMSRLTFDPKQDAIPVWSPDGRQIAWDSERSGVRQIYRKDAGGGGQEEQLTNGPNAKSVSDWSRDGRYLLYSDIGPKTGSDIWALPLEGERKPVLVLQTPFVESAAEFSPDGKWIAYQSNESGRFEVYVRAFPLSQGGKSQGQWQVSNQGGAIPKWRADGKELYYLGPNRNEIMAVSIRTSESGVQADTPSRLFAISAPSSSVGFPYDVSADGQRFLIMQPANAQQGPAPLTVVLNWQAGLKK